jgi:hypothetical protein
VLETHGSVCPKRLIRCGCNTRVVFDALAEHKATECPNEVVACTYAEMGCTSSMCRKNLAHHLNSNGRQHAQMLWSGMQDLQQKAKDSDALQQKTLDYDKLQLANTTLRRTNALLQQQIKDYEKTNDYAMSSSSRLGAMY